MNKLLQWILHFIRQAALQVKDILCTVCELLSGLDLAFFQGGGGRGVGSARRLGVGAEPWKL